MISENDLSMRKRLIHDYLVALVDIYGVCEYDQFLKVFNDYNSEHLTKEEVINAAPALNNLKKGYFIYENIIVTTRLKKRSLDKLIKLQKDKPYYYPKKEEIIARQTPKYFEETTVVLVLKQFLLDELSVRPLRVDPIIAELIFTIKSQTEPATNRLKVLERHGVVFDSINQADAYIKKYNTLYQTTKTWANRGYSLLEITEQFRNSVENNSLLVN